MSTKADDILNNMMGMSRSIPLAPDFPQSFVPQAVAPSIQNADIVVSRGPGRQFVLVYGTVNGYEVSAEDVLDMMRGHTRPELQSAKVAVIPCNTEEEVDFLTRMTREIKAGKSDAPGSDDQR